MVICIEARFDEEIVGGFFVEDLYELVESGEYVVVGDREVAFGGGIAEIVGLSVYLIGDQVIEHVSYCERPVEKKLPEDLAHEVHGNALPKLDMKQRKVSIDKRYR